MTSRATLKITPVLQMLACVTLCGSIGAPVEFKDIIDQTLQNSPANTVRGLPSSARAACPRRDVEGIFLIGGNKSTGRFVRAVKGKFLSPGLIHSQLAGAFA
jgi:hypothetical protein